MKTLDETFLLDAAAVARNAGLPLRQKGARFWTCCPLHGEKTPSMCFFPDGKYHCFGCGAHGDAADLYAALHGVSLAEALRAVKGETRPAPKPKALTAAELHRKLYEWKSERWTQACHELHEAEAAIAELEGKNSPNQLAGLPAFYDAISRKAAANDTLNLLDSATMAQLLKMCAEDK